MKSCSSHTTFFFQVILNIPVLGLETLAKTKRFNMEDRNSIEVFLIRLQENSAQCSVQRLFSPTCKIRGFFCCLFSCHRTKPNMMSYAFNFSELLRMESGTALTSSVCHSPSFTPGKTYYCYSHTVSNLCLKLH